MTERRSCRAYDRTCEQKAACFPGMCSRLREWLAAEAIGDEVNQPLDVEDYDAQRTVQRNAHGTQGTRDRHKGRGGMTT